jgi:peroxiredoxin (alkyl hydroperoxide reductase subunit C)
MLTLIGQPAPDFIAPIAASGDALNASPRAVSLADYHGRWLVFLWYPADFTFVCPTELLAISDRLDEFADMDAAVLGASTDSVYSHRACLNTPRSQNGIEGLRFPLLADKPGRIDHDFGILLEEEGVALRGLFVIDPAGIVQYAVAHNLSTGRSVDETLRVLAALQTGELCGSDWEPGQDTL